MALEKTWRWFGENDTVTLPEIRQIGVEGIVTALHHIPTGEIWPVEEIEKVRDRIAAAGMRWECGREPSGIGGDQTPYGGLRTAYRELPAVAAESGGLRNPDRML